MSRMQTVKRSIDKMRRIDMASYTIPRRNCRTLPVTSSWQLSCPAGLNAGFAAVASEASTTHASYERVVAETTAKSGRLR